MSEIIKNTGSFESFDGTSIYYEVRGEGQPIVMAYGLACQMNHWNLQTKYFSKNYQTILFDYRAHGKSTTPSMEQISVNAMAEDLIALANHLKLKKASYWAHSFGSPILLEAFAKEPSLFENMIFVNGFATNPIKKMFGNDLAINVFRLVQRGYKVIPDPLDKLWKITANNILTQYTTALLGGFNINLASFHDIEIYSRAVGAMDLKIFMHIFETMMDFDGRDLLPKVSVPTLLIGGTQDTVTPLKHQELMHSMIPKSQYLVVPYGSHCTHVDMPDFVNLRIEKFLQECGYA